MKSREPITAAAFEPYGGYEHASARELRTWVQLRVSRREPGTSRPRSTARAALIAWLRADDAASF